VTLPQRLSFVILGARNMTVLREFYAALGWSERPGSDDNFAAFDAESDVLALYPIERLGAEAAPSEPLPEPGWNGVTLGINVENADAVDEAFTVAQAAGAHSIASPVRREWGGYSTYVVDPEGNRWEIAWASTSRDAHGPFAPADGVLVGAPQAFYARLELDDGPVEAQPEVCSCRRSD
jgi:predicted lactoylglutathione lyase